MFVKKLDAPRHVGRHGRVPVKASLANFSPRGVDEVVLAVVERLSASADRGAAPARRVHARAPARAGTATRCRLSFDVDRLAVTQAGGKSVVPGAYRLWVDGASRTFVVH